ncbi:MAG: lytic transglycosylase domain-containing protein [Elusimicrobiota bacterium]|jgi:soluble lytic murein transglycosylase|nr:lytic transglycosylase domain-containing protein [Elusimicrobiota bacterium]
MMHIKGRYILCIIVVIVLTGGVLYLQRSTGIFYRVIYADIIDRYARRFKVDPLLVGAVMRKESSINPLAVSHKGAVGLMQLMPSTAQEIAIDLNIGNYNHEMLKDPAINVMFGTYYLRRLSIRYDNNLIMTLGAYNAGIGNIDVARFIKAGQDFEINDLPFEETQKYVASILLTYKFYKTIDNVEQAFFRFFEITREMPRRIIEEI